MNELGLEQGNLGHRAPSYPGTTHTKMDSLIRRIPSHLLVVGIYILIVAFAVVAFMNPV